MNAPSEFWSERYIQKGLKSISGKKWLNSIMMTAVMVNQIAENTGAVVRNFFMAFRGLGLEEGVRARGREQPAQRGETVILLSAWVSLPLVNSPKAAKGQLAAARVLLKARGTSIWISCMVASLRVATAWR